MRSNKQLVDALRTAPAGWIDAAIVVAFENRFEFIGEDHPDPVNRVKYLQNQGGLAIGLAGVKPGGSGIPAFLAQVFQEYEDQGWAHQYMDKLRGIVRRQSFSK